MNLFYEFKYLLDFESWSVLQNNRPSSKYTELNIDFIDTVEC